MKTLIVVPARYGSTRFPGKPLVEIAGRTMVSRVAAMASRAAAELDDAASVVATDDERIASHCRDLGIEVVMTDPNVPSGTDRALAAVDAISRYQGWDGADPAPARIAVKRRQFADALAAGVPMCLGSDVGVFDHGDQAVEAELMVAYGMAPLDVLRAATSGNATMLRLEDRIGSVRPGMRADLVVVEGDPSVDMAALRQVRRVVQGGRVVR